MCQVMMTPSLPRNSGNNTHTNNTNPRSRCLHHQSGGKTPHNLHLLTFVFFSLDLSSNFLCDFLALDALDGSFYARCWMFFVVALVRHFPIFFQFESLSICRYVCNADELQSVWSQHATKELFVVKKGTSWRVTPLSKDCSRNGYVWLKPI